MAPCRVFICYWGDILVGFRAMLLLPNGDIRDFYMGHRLVVLPDYQGMGIGVHLNDFCGEVMLNDGQKYYCKTAHFKLKNYYKSRPTWKVMKEEMKKYTKGCECLKTNLPKGVDPYSVSYPFKIYDSRDGSNGKNISKWINRSLISARYLGKDYIEKPHRILVVESELDRKGIIDALKPYIDKDKFYIEAICGGTRNEDDMCFGCHDLGIQSYPFDYKNFLHVRYILDGTFDGMEGAEIVYFYDDKRKSFLEEFKKRGCACVKVADSQTKKELFDF